MSKLKDFGPHGLGLGHGNKNADACEKKLQNHVSQ